MTAEILRQIIKSLACCIGSRVFIIFVGTRYYGCVEDRLTVHEKWDLNTGILSGDAMLF
jgi:hypothetical protein